MKTYNNSNHKNNLKMYTKLLFFAIYLIGFKVITQSPNEAHDTIKTWSDSTSKVMQSVSYLSDVYGSRLMGTPNYYNAVLWAKKELESWGIHDVKLQSFDKNYIG